MKTQYSKKKILKLAGVTTLALALGIGAAYWQMKSHFDKTLADEIRSEFPVPSSELI